MTYPQFWRRYLRAHSDPRTRALHYVGSSLAVAAIVTAAAERDWRWLVAAPVAGYAMAWFGHLKFEHNRPETFGHPVWSLISEPPGLVTLAVTVMPVVPEGIELIFRMSVATPLVPEGWGPCFVYWPRVVVKLTFAPWRGFDVYGIWIPPHTLLRSLGRLPRLVRTHGHGRRRPAIGVRLTVPTRCAPCARTGGQEATAGFDHPTHGGPQRVCAEGFF